MPDPESLSFEEVRRLLPQAPPFLMVDRVEELHPGERIVAVRNVTGNEPYFQGHFPSLAVMPAALILEALAQATILLTRRTAERAGAPGGAGDEIHLFGSVKARMHRPVFPGDVLRLEVRLLKLYGEGGAAEGKALVQGTVCTEAEMYFVRTRRDALLRRGS